MSGEPETSRLSRQLAAVDREIAARDEEIARLQRDLASQVAEVGRLRADLAAHDGTLAGTREAARLSAEIERLESTVRELHASTSWKVTAPIRALKNAGLRLRAYLREAIVALARSRRSTQLADEVALISQSCLFDPEYYAAQAAEVRERGLDPAMHYVTRGAAEGFDPHPLFDSAYYRAAGRPGLDPGGNPLVHFLTHGAVEGRSPSPLFDAGFYLAQNPDVAASCENPLLHYLRAGARAGRDPHPLFDTAFYLEQKPQVAALGVNPLVHFALTGSTHEFDPLSLSRSLPDTGICVVTPDIVGPVKNGGIGTACYHFARLLAEAGHAVTILFTLDLSPCRRAHWKNTYARMGIEFLSLSDMPPVTHHVHGSNWFLERSWRVFKYLERASYSVVHFQDWHANGFWSIRAKRLGLAFEQTTLTVMTHSPTKWQDDGMQHFGPEPIETAKLVWTETYAIEHCDVLLSPTRYMLEWLSREGARLPESVLVTPNAYTENTEAKGVTPEVDNDHLIFFGRLETRKGLHVFGEALRQLRREGGPLPRRVSFLGTLVTVNGRPAAEYLDALRRDLVPVEFCVISDLDHLGARDYIERSRGLVVIPSLVDNCPFVVIECIENCLPFLAARTGGIPDMVDARATFEPTPAALAARLAERQGIDHAAMRHPYSVRDAARIWRDLHGEQGPLGEPTRSSQRPARDARESPRVSACIPFFEQQRYLATLVAAFQDQSYADLEIIVVNDGSGPEASQEFDRVAACSRDPRFRFLTTENRGPGAARNAAAEVATGDLLLFFDADGLPKDRDFVATLVRALRWSGADCLTCAYDIVSAEPSLATERDIASTYRPWGACLEAGFFENVLGNSTMILWCSVFTRLGGFPTKRASWEAHEFLLRLCFQGFRLETFPEALLYHRESPSGRNQEENHFLKFQSLFEQLQGAPRADLARIIATVGGPTLVARLGGGSARRVGC